MGMNMQRWVANEEYRAQLEELLRNPVLISAMELIELDARPSVDIKGRTSDYMDNIALMHSYQSGIVHAIDKLKSLPYIRPHHKMEAGESWAHFAKRVEDDAKKEEEALQKKQQ